MPVEEPYPGFLELIERSHQAALLLLLFAIADLGLFGLAAEFELVGSVFAVWTQWQEVVLPVVCHLQGILKILADLRKTGSILRLIFQHLCNQTCQLSRILSIKPLNLKPNPVIIVSISGQTLMVEQEGSLQQTKAQHEYV